MHHLVALDLTVDSNERLDSHRSINIDLLAALLGPFTLAVSLGWLGVVPVPVVLDGHGLVNVNLLLEDKLALGAKVSVVFPVMTSRHLPQDCRNQDRSPRQRPPRFQSPRSRCSQRT